MENPLSAGLDYMRQKRERTGMSYYKLPVTLHTAGSHVRSTSGSQNIAVLLNHEQTVH